MYAYCGNDPISFKDALGNHREVAYKAIYEGSTYDFEARIREDIRRFDLLNTSEHAVLNSNYFSGYNGAFVLRTNGNRSGSFGIIFITRETNDRKNPEDMVRHEYGHLVQLSQLNIITYLLWIALPSWQEWGNGPYYSKPWEITADLYGGVQSRNHTQHDKDIGYLYLELGKAITSSFKLLFK